MRSAADELASWLDSMGAGVFAGTTGWAIAVAQEPVSPDDVITLYGTGGPSPGNLMIELRQPTIQVRTRARSYREGQAKQQEVFELLNSIQGLNIEGHHYIGVYLTGDVIDIGRDDNDRYLATSNYQVQRGPAQ